MEIKESIDRGAAFYSQPKITEQTMIRALRGYFQNGYTYRLDNAYIFAYDWESDFFCVNVRGYSYEFEVKISKADFKVDQKKVKKHEILLTGSWTDRFKDQEHVIRHHKSPNRFYYVVPEGMLTAEEVPAYAGLITISGSQLNFKKRAPLLHKRVFDFRKCLCDKFYFKWCDEKRKRSLMGYDMEVMQQKIDKFKKEFPEQYKTIYAW